jgi:hypothetical protein
LWFDIEACLACGGTVNVVASIENHAVIRSRRRVDGSRRFGMI